MGHSQGSSVAIAYAVRHPERVSHLILCGSYARGACHRGSAELLEARRALETFVALTFVTSNPAFFAFVSSFYIPRRIRLKAGVARTSSSSPSPRATSFSSCAPDEISIAICCPGHRPYLVFQRRRPRRSTRRRPHRRRESPTRASSLSPAAMPSSRRRTRMEGLPRRTSAFLRT
jgi:pimeloyl-ACP methyl ester carboxylesterase